MHPKYTKSNNIFTMIIKHASLFNKKSEDEFANLSHCAAFYVYLHQNILINAVVHHYVGPIMHFFCCQYKKRMLSRFRGKAEHVTRDLHHVKKDFMHVFKSSGASVQTLKFFKGQLE